MWIMVNKSDMMSTSNETNFTNTIEDKKMKLNKMIKSKNNKYKMTQQYYQISFIVGIVLCLTLTAPNVFVLADEDDTTATTEFDPSTRGIRKFSDKCDNTQDCGFQGSFCDPNTKVCQCNPDVPATNHIDKCGRAASVNETCFFNEQCESATPETECRDQRCICRFEKTPTTRKDGSIECIAVKQEPSSPSHGPVNPAMIMILVGMALMFIIICVVLRLFAKARWADSHTIFNTPNPRLMNVSLLRDNKLLHGQERRGSRMSVRMPSRQPSMASLRPHSPNASIGKTGSRRGSRNSSSASATSMRSNRSLQPHKQADHHGHNGQHTVVTDPQQLFSVNQQQHMQHQLQLHAAAQERRNSTVHHHSEHRNSNAHHHHNEHRNSTSHHNTEHRNSTSHHNAEHRNSNPVHHHATERRGSTAVHPNVHHVVQPQQHHPTPNQLESQQSPKLQNVKVEITEPKN